MSDPLAPGDKVECVAEQTIDGVSDPRAFFAKSGIALPVVGHVYTVRECLMWRFSDGMERAALRLSEIINPECNWRDGDFSEIAFSIRKFRPLRNRSTDIERFRRIDADVFNKVRV